MNRRRVVIAGSFLSAVIAGLACFFLSSRGLDEPSRIGNGLDSVRTTADEERGQAPPSSSATPYLEADISQRLTRGIGEIEDRDDTDGSQSWQPDIEGFYSEFVNLSMSSRQYEMRSRNGCRTPAYFLIEMKLEPRDDEWADETEAAMRRLLRYTASGRVRVSPRCHSTICRVVVYADSSTDLMVDLAPYWRDVAPAFRASDVGREFAKSRAIHGRRGNGDWFIIWTLVRKSREWNDEPPICNGWHY